MQTLSTLLTITFVIVAALLMLVILLQSNRSSGMGLFGGGSQSAFGASSGDVLTKITAYLTAFFLILALSLAYIKSRESNLSGIRATPTLPQSPAQTEPGTNPEEMEQGSSQQPLPAEENTAK